MNSTIRAVSIVIVVSFASAVVVVSAGGPAADGGHVIQIDRPILAAEEGLLLGNGDLSVSVYQTADQIVWRFGKGDVWDRRLDMSDDPKPVHIDEIAHGIEVEGWKCGPYGGPVVATRGTKNPERMREICQGCPPSYHQRPYPCPKPVGELALHFPADLPGMTIRQRLLIEEAKLLIECSWSSGVKITLESFIPPKPNVLVLRWKVENWNAQTRMGNKPPVWFSLYRWADPTVQEFAAKFFADCRHEAFNVRTNPKITPLPPPTTKREGDCWGIEQRFPPDPLFQGGFRYLIMPFVWKAGVEPVDMKAVQEARLHILPGQDAVEGQLAVAVATASDPGGPSEEIKRIRGGLGDPPAATLTRWADENHNAATEFWSRSKVSIADPLLENLWYETFHARRCVYRRGTVPPGLYLPSTVRDYSHWHGDYHTNYNIQEPFWGDYAANHLELGDAYFDAIAFALPIGRKIAKDYYNCRGAFIQLTMYPILAEDDPLGTAPMGRMAYMTGWAMNQYWWRYLYTLDKEWLRSTGYPVIRDCALFYIDFMKKRADGLYHIFPSSTGEDGYSGNAKDFTDRAQVMQHMRYCLRATIRASEALDVDEDLALNAAIGSNTPPATMESRHSYCRVWKKNATMPTRRNSISDARTIPSRTNFESRPLPKLGWYFGKEPWATLGKLRGGEFVAERDLPAFRHLVEAWRRPNGLIWGLAVANYGRAGAWTESLGVAAPLQEMMLQSWDGGLRIFPAWPKNLDARFENFLAEGAFVVTAAWSRGRVTTLSLRSEKGGPCILYSPWPCGIRVTDSDGDEVQMAPDRYGRPSFATRANMEYHLRPQ